MALTGRDLLLIVVAIILPPLAVFLEVGKFGAEVIINICLTILGYLPGMAGMTHQPNFAKKLVSLGSLL